MRATVKTIAELAGVSRGTVDRVLNNRTGVKPAVRARVQQIADMLDYKPNLIGKALVHMNEAVRIGIILTPEYNPFVAEIRKGIMRAYDEYRHFGLDLDIRMLTTLDPVEQYALLNKLEEQGVQAIGLIPLDDSIIRNKLNELSEKGVAIITFNSQLSGVQQLCFIGQDHIRGGSCAAGLMGRILPKHSKIAVVISSNTLACHQDRLQGFRRRLAARYPTLEIVNVVENLDRSDLAYERTVDLIGRYPDLGGIYITGGGILGLGRALSVTGKAGVIRIVSHDFVEGTEQLLCDGTLDFAIGQNPEQQGYQVVNLFFNYLVKRQQPPFPFMEIAVEIATEDSLLNQTQIALPLK